LLGAFSLQHFAAVDVFDVICITRHNAVDNLFAVTFLLEILLFGGSCFFER
jgi:hypothetical protein